jgi:hypothetical protein
LNNYQAAKENNIPFYAIVQSFGEWDNDHWKNWLYPTPTMQKCLQYLPLCYGASGVINFALKHGNTDYITSLDDPSSPDENYVALVTANEKLQFYGHILKQAIWKGSVCIDYETPLPLDFPLGDQHFTNMCVIDPHNDEPYWGYIQCGFFSEGADNYYILVNRRTDKFTGSCPANTSTSNYFTSYHTMLPQTVQFCQTLESLIYTNLWFGLYGPSQGLYDPLTTELSVFQLGTANITVAAGEATLRKIVSVLPIHVFSNYSMNRDVWVVGDEIGNTFIDTGLTVTIPPGCCLTLQPNTCLYVMSGSTLSIQGSLNAKSGSRIYVCMGGSLIIENANCLMGSGSNIFSENSSLAINNSQFNSISGGQWQGILGKNSTINVQFSSFSNASMTFCLGSSNFTMMNSSIYVPSNGIGIYSEEFETVNNQIFLTSSHNSTNLIKGLTSFTTGTTGIKMLSKTPSFNCNLTNFENLSVGIEYSRTAANSDVIEDCSFQNCLTAIKISGSSGISHIGNCEFTFNDINETTNACGVYAQSYVPQIDGCHFSSNSTANQVSGILLDMAQSNSREGISNCIFDNLQYGIESRESQVNVTNNQFNSTFCGIAIGTKSLIDCSYKAHNRFNSRDSNVGFLDNSINQPGKFVANLLLVEGHNDFYDAASGFDFNFDDQYDIPNSNKINADGNFWGITLGSFDHIQSPRINPPSCVGLVHCCSPDDHPNCTTVPAPQNRFIEALSYEAIDDYLTAYFLYEQILSDRLPEEKELWDLCIPKVFKIAKSYHLDYDALVAYYDYQISITNPTDKIELIRLMYAYKAFTCLEKKDYQGAANIISYRISNPISDIDSLNAVMDLEIVYLQRELDDSKRPLSYSFDQYHYPTLSTFETEHQKHWNQLQTLYNQNNEPNNSVPTAVILSRNYPNPFNPSTTISYSLKDDAKVVLEVYNIKGQLVKTLAGGLMSKGKHSIVWEGKDNAGTQCASGIYLYKLRTGNTSITRKMMLLK